MPTELDAAVESYLDCFPDSACSTELDLLREVADKVSHAFEGGTVLIGKDRYLNKQDAEAVDAALAKLDAHRKAQGENK